MDMPDWHLDRQTIAMLRCRLVLAAFQPPSAVQGRRGKAYYDIITFLRYYLPEVVGKDEPRARAAITSSPFMRAAVDHGRTTPETGVITHRIGDSTGLLKKERRDRDGQVRHCVKRPARSTYGAGRAGEESLCRHHDPHTTGFRLKMSSQLSSSAAPCIDGPWGAERHRHPWVFRVFISRLFALRHQLYAEQEGAAAACLPGQIIRQDSQEGVRGPEDVPERQPTVISYQDVRGSNGLPKQASIVGGFLVVQSSGVCCELPSNACESSPCLPVPLLVLFFHLRPRHGKYEKTRLLGARETRKMKAIGRATTSGPSQVSRLQLQQRCKCSTGEQDLHSLD